MNRKSRILAVSLSPCLDITAFLPRTERGGINYLERVVVSAGGKGSNVARVATALGEPADLFQVVGGSTGRELTVRIREEGMRTINVEVAEPTRRVFRVYESGNSKQTAFVEPGPQLSAREVKALRDRFKEIAPRYDILCFSGAAPCQSIENIYFDLIKIAKSLGRRTILDTRGKAFALGLKAGPSVVKPNLDETVELFGKRFCSPAGRLRALEAYHDQGVETVVLSLGAGGALVSSGNTQLCVVPPKIREQNSVGSGDALVAGLAVGLLRNMTLAEAARLAVAAGTANAASMEIGHVQIKLVQAFFKQTVVKLI